MVKKTSAAKTPKTNRLMDSSVFPIPNKGAAFPNTVIVMMECKCVTQLGCFHSLRFLFFLIVSLSLSYSSFR